MNDDLMLKNYKKILKNLIDEPITKTLREMVDTIFYKKITIYEQLDEKKEGNYY